jgi:membrane fusion protein (multidrug efflux system)
MVTVNAFSHRLCPVLFALAFLTVSCRKKQFTLPPPDVGVLELVPRDVDVYVEWVATLDANVNAQIRAQVSGYLLAQNYKEGEKVKKGALLFQIDPRQFQAAYDQVKAKYDQTASDVKRYTPLAATDAISKQELDQAVSSNLAARAELDRAQLDLDFTRVVAPVDGVAGLSNVHIGDLIGPSTVLTTVTQIDPAKANISVSEQQYLNYIRQYTTNASRERFIKDARFDLVLGDGSVYARKGRCYSFNNQEDPNTGTFQVVLAFPNPDYILRPGQFARVRLPETVKGALVVPASAVMEMQGSRQVAVIDASGVVHMRSVTTGDLSATGVVIAGGLKAGERVVAEGIMKVHDNEIVHCLPYKDAGLLASGKTSH